MNTVDQQTYTAPNGVVYEKKQAIFSERLFKIRMKSGVFRFIDNLLHKRCSRCRDYFPADTEFFYAATGEKDGLCNWCKACYQEWRYPNGRSNASAKHK